MFKKRELLIVFCLLAICDITSADINKGLLAYWSFDECTAKDESGNSYDGTIQGSPICEDGIVGRALKFNTEKTSDWIDLGNNFPSPKQFTLSVWINVAKLPAYSWCNEGTIFIKGSACTNKNISYHMSIDGSFYPPLIRVDIGDGSGAYMNVGTEGASGLNPPILNRWIHMLSSYNGYALTIYANGKKNCSRQTQMIPQDNQLPAAIAKSLYDSTPTAFSGLLDEMRIYNRALSASEINDLYNQSNMTFGVGGTVNGTNIKSVMCYNITTNKTVIIDINQNETSWNCKKSGLLINKGDMIMQIIKGDAQ